MDEREVAAAILQILDESKEPQTRTQLLDVIRNHKKYRSRKWTELDVTKALRILVRGAHDVKRNRKGGYYIEGSKAHALDYIKNNPPKSYGQQLLK